MLTVRPVNHDDAGLLLGLAKRCPPLDVHTPYTYWVICHSFAETSFVLRDDADPVGFLTGVGRGQELLIWQIGILPAARGQGASVLLLNALEERSAAMGITSFTTTIAPSNAASNGAMRSWCTLQGLTMTRAGTIVVPEHEDDEAEVLLRIAGRTTS